MTFEEFKAWMDGFSEGVKGSPTKDQWEKIQDKLKEVVAPNPIWINPSPPIWITPQPYQSPFRFTETEVTWISSTGSSTNSDIEVYQ
jgi:hypothetical protein